jgi:hypothetical protein
MSLRFCTLLGTCLLLATVTGECSEDTATATDEKILPSLLAYDASRYPGQWCVVTFVQKSRSALPRNSTTATRATYSYSPSGIDRAVIDSETSLAYRSSFIENIMETRFLHLMTLWQGHENALLLGIDDRGMLEVTMD